MKNGKNHSIATRCQHGGRRPRPGDSAVTTPIVQSSTFVLAEEDYRLIREGRVLDTLMYSRYGNPTVAAAEARLANLEGAERAVLFASGMAAIHAGLMASLAPGGHVVAADRLYGGTRELMLEVLPKVGCSATFVDIEDLDAVNAAIRPDTRILHVESIANPTLEVTDLVRLAEVAHERATKLVVDATFATPILQRPLELGADLVLHSASKYLSGHSDLIGGAVCGSGSLIAEVETWRRRAGGCMDPQAAFLIDRGMKTLAVRMRAHCENAIALATFFEEHPKVRLVRHPSLASHPHHERAGELLADFGGMVYFEVEGDDLAGQRIIDSLELALPAPSLGGTETLVCQPCLTSHAGLTTEQRGAAGIGPGAVRISVGIEGAVDLIADFGQALERA